MQIYNNKLIVPDSRGIQQQLTNNKVCENKNDIRNFDEILKNKIDSSNLQFSKHATMRLNNRSIILSNDQIKRIEAGVNKAVQKGIQDSLVLVDDVALVVNVKNRIVITAIDKNSSNENIFTNIDGAVIV